MTNQDKYIDLIISPADSGNLNSAKHYRKLSVTNRGGMSVINFRLPEHVQEMIVDAYEHGKEVRIFA